MTKKLILSTLFFILSFFTLISFSSKQAFAYIYCDGSRCGGGVTLSSTSCDPSVPPGYQYCNFSGVSYCGEGYSWQCPYTYCGWSSNACCGVATPWSKYSVFCGTLNDGPTCLFGESAPNCTGPNKYTCDTVVQNSGFTCSIGDKCAVQPTAILQPGQCDCSVGPFNYKTCCNTSTGTTTNAICYPANDGTGNTNGDCPTGGQYATVFCGFNGQPACGQASCDQFAPWQIVNGHVQSTTGTALPGVTVTIYNSSRSITHTFTTDGNGNYQDNATTVRKNDNFSVTANSSSGATPCQSGYICGNSWSPNSPNPYTASNSSGCWVSNTNTWTCPTFQYTPGKISGTVYIDYNHNQIVDGSDGPSNVALTITDSSGTQTTSNTTDGSFTLSGAGMSQGSHTVTASIAAPGWSIENPTQTVSIGQNISTMTFYITPTFTISGNIFNDVNKDGFYNPASNPPNGNPAGNDTPYAGAATVKITGPSSTTLNFSGGSYTSGQTLYAGTYTIQYTNLPTGYQTTYPLNGPPPALQVTIGNAINGAACTPNGSHDATCDGNGNIINADFGITNEFAWVQGICSDMRVDSGFTDPIPATANCGGSSGPYANICTSGTVGIIYSGNTDASFLSGSASTNNWVAGGSSYPESFTPVNQTVIRTSYSYVTTSLQQAGITAQDLSSYCTLSNCNPPPGLPSGVYLANGNLNLVTSIAQPTQVYSAPINTNITILVNGTTTINGTISVPQNSGSAFTLISSGNIIIPANVGAASMTSLTSQLDGLYSTDKSFIIQSAAGGKCNLNGTSNDLKLNIAGGVIVNAGEQGGSFQNSRDLCINDTSCPVNTISQRLDLILNAPDIIKHRNNFFQEVAP